MIAWNDNVSKTVVENIQEGNYTIGEDSTQGQQFWRPKTCNHLLQITQ